MHGISLLNLGNAAAKAVFVAFGLGALIAVPASISAGDLSMQRLATAEIYYFDWDVITRSRLSIDDVRRMYHAKIFIRGNHQVHRFIKKVGIDKLAPAAAPDHEVDVRVVIDLAFESGEVRTLFADRFHLYSMDSRSSTPVDDRFRDAFRVY